MEDTPPEFIDEPEPEELEPVEEEDSFDLDAIDDELASEVAEEDIMDIRAEVQRKYVGHGGIVSSYKNAEERRRTQDRTNAEDYILWIEANEAQLLREKDEAAEKVSAIQGAIVKIEEDIFELEQAQTAGTLPDLEIRRLEQQRADLVLQRQDCEAAEMEMFRRR